MGVRTRPGIKHDHHHNQQQEALAEQHRNGIGPCSPPAAGWYPGLCRWHCLLPRDGGGRAVLPLSLDGCWASAAPGAAPSSRVRGSAGPLWLTQPWCPGTGQRVPLVPWLCWVVVLSTVGAPANYGFFFIFLGFFFAFLAANLTLQVPWRKQNCAQGAASLPAPPHRGQSRAAAPGEGPWAGARALPPLPNQIPSLEPAIWGTGPHAAPPGFSRGIGVGPQPERQRTGTAQCLCERVAAWDGAAGDGQGKTKNPPK